MKLLCNAAKTVLKTARKVMFPHGNNGRIKVSQLACVSIGSVCTISSTAFFCRRFAYEFAEPSFANSCTSIFVASSGRGGLVSLPLYKFIEVCKVYTGTYIICVLLRNYYDG